MSNSETVDSSKQPLAHPEIRGAFDALTNLQDEDMQHVVEKFITSAQPHISQDAKSKDYVIKRLVLGVTSTRKASRLPFANALWVFLNTEEASENSPEQMFEILLSKTDVKKLVRLTSMEETEQLQLAGCLTVCLIVAKVKGYVNLEILSTLHQKFLNTKMEFKDSFWFVYDFFLMESLEVISKQNYKANLWPSFSVSMQSLKQEMSSSLAIEMFLLLRRFPKLSKLLTSLSGDINAIDKLDNFSLDNFISFNLGKMPFLHPCMTSFLRTFQIGSKMFERLWKSLLKRNEANVPRLVWHVLGKSCVEGISEQQLQLILTSDFLHLLNNLSLEVNAASKPVQEWVSSLGQNRLPFLWHILQNCSKCPRFLSCPIFQNSLALEDDKNQRLFFRHIEELIFSSNRVSEVDTLVSLVSKFSSSLEKIDKASVKLRTMIDKILIRVSFTKVSNSQKSLGGKAADILFHAVRSRLLSNMGDFAQEIFDFVSSHSESAPVASELILSSDSIESLPYIKQIIAVIILDICIHNGVQEEYACYLKSLLEEIRQIPRWLTKKGEKGDKKRKKSDVFEIENVVSALIKLMNIPNKFYYNLANACFKSICDEHIKDLNADLLRKLLGLHEKLISSREQDQEPINDDDAEGEMSSDDAEESCPSESEPESEPEGEAPWEKEYFAQNEDDQVMLDEALDDEQVAQLEKFDQLWENQMKKKKPAFAVSDVDSVKNFLHLLDCLLKDSCDEDVLKSCFVFTINSLTKSQTEDELGIMFEMCYKILSLGNKKFVKTLNTMSSEESGEIISELINFLFCVSFPLKDKMYLTACKVVTTLLANCEDDTKTGLFGTFRTDYFLPWVNEGKCMNVSRFLNELFKLKPALFWMFLKKGSGNGKQLVLAGNSAAIKRIHTLLTPGKFTSRKSTKKTAFFLTLCRIFLDAASSNVSLVQKQTCIQTVHLVSKFLNLKSSTELLDSSSQLLETLKTKVFHTLKYFKDVDINQSHLNHLRNLADDFDIDVNTDEDLAYLRKRSNVDSRKRKQVSAGKSKDSSNIGDIQDDTEEVQMSGNVDIWMPKKKSKKIIDDAVSNIPELEPQMEPVKKKKKIEKAVKM